MIWWAVIVGFGYFFSVAEVVVLPAALGRDCSLADRSLAEAADCIHHTEVAVVVSDVRRVVAAAYSHSGVVHRQEQIFQKVRTSLSLEPPSEEATHVLSTLIRFL